MIITHAALTLQEVPPGSPELRRGMPVARCGWQNDGHGVAVAWERRFVDCPLCLLELDQIPVTPGTELPVREPRRPDYVDPGATYVPWPIGAPEFQEETGRRLNLFQTLAIWTLVVAAVVTVIAISSRWSDTATRPSHGPRPAVVTPTPYGDPPDEVIGADIIWTRHR